MDVKPAASMGGSFRERTDHRRVRIARDLGVVIAYRITTTGQVCPMAEPRPAWVVESVGPCSSNPVMLRAFGQSSRIREQPGRLEHRTSRKRGVLGKAEAEADP